MDDCANAQYPPITGELRELVADVNWHEITDNIGGPWLDSWHRAMRNRCDTIDAIHARLEAAYDRLRAERDSMAAALDRAEGEHEYAPESHYMMLPKDADGEPIHVGDWIIGRWNAKAKVVAVTSDDVYWWEPDGCHWCHAFEVRHYHAPTVEDVLREFVAEFNRDDSELCDEEIIERFAAKLRLAGDAE